MLPRVRFAVRASVLFGFGSLCLWSLAGEGRPVGGESAASLIHYDVAGGDSYFALALRAPLLGIPVAHDHVLIVDTSASQTGVHREQALKVVDSCLASLPAADRVKVLAVDVEVTPLSNGFYAADAAETRAALQQLRRRVPLGASHLAPALEASLAAFSGERAKSIIYVGDGMSTGHLIDGDNLRDLAARLHREHVPVHSFAIGPRTDLQVLGLLATHTGGVVVIDELIDDRKQSAEAVGRKLAQAADAPVFYAETLNVEPAVESLLPTDVPPIRSDRETIVLGKGPVGASLKVTATSTDRNLNWTVKPAAPQPGNTFLAALWNIADRSGGWGVSVAGQELLNVSRQQYEEQVQNLVGLGKQAVATRNLDQAEQIALAVRDADPNNVEAETILNATQKVKELQTRLARMQPGAPPPAPQADDPASVREDDLTQSFRDFARVRTERLTRTVAQTIEQAQKAASADPDMAIGGLKQALNAVTSSTDIDPVDLETLRRRVQSAIDQVSALKVRIDLDKVERQRRLAASEARAIAIDELVQREEKLAQLIEKVRSLMEEGFQGNENAWEEAEAVARAAWELAPYHGVTAAAIFDTEAAGQLDKIQRLRNLRADKFLEALYLVEKAHVPFPDEPPVLWPAPEVWQDLTNRRKKWASVDLKKYNKAEERIRSSLDNPTETNFLELPLEDAINYLKEYHAINIWIDRQAMIDEGVALDQAVSLNLAGVTLRSTLKLLLEPLQLTWVIEDEVMKITTVTKAGERLTTRVYPVADLVIPITSGMPGGIGQGLGGAGGVGGVGAGGGAFGGGQFGAGGGMMGGMGMMNVTGLGFMNVADDTVAPKEAPAEFNNSAIRDRKKKRLNDN